MLLITLAVSMLVARGITRPLQRMTGTMKDLAGGKLDVEVPGIGRHDEIGEMAEAVEVFKSNAVARLELEAEQKEAETRAAARRKADMHKLADDFEGAVGEIIETVSSASTELEASAGTLSSTAERARGTRDDGCSGLRRSLHQCAVGGVGHRRNGLVRQRDQPPGAGIGADGQ